jgi:hypothetical protein
MSFMNLSKMVTSVITLISLIVTTITGLIPEKEEPVFPQISEVTDKRDYEEGEFVLNTYDLVVANNGNDNWSGRLKSPNAAMDDGPLRTIQAAKEKMKQYRDIDWAGTIILMRHCSSTVKTLQMSNIRLVPARRWS